MASCRVCHFYGGDHGSNDLVYCTYFKDIRPASRARDCPGFRE